MFNNRFIKQLIMAAFLFFTACNSVISNQYDYRLLPEDKEDGRFMSVEILTSFGMDEKDPKFGRVSELSGMAWDFDDKKLYAVTDEGLLHHFDIEFETNDSQSNSGKKDETDAKKNINEKGFNSRSIKSIRLEKTFRLSDSSGKKLSKKKSDSEGLALLNHQDGKQGNSQLLISFEGKARVEIFNTAGVYQEKVRLAKFLTKKKSYRGGNKGLESVTIHPEYGVITAAELPLKHHKLGQQTLYGERIKKGEKSVFRQWHFEGGKYKNNSVTGMETLPDGNVLVLERSWSGMSSPVIISLRKVFIKQCNDNEICKVKDIAIFSSADGWMLDNFEAVTHLGGDLYLMVSDDNGSPLQSTVFVLFRLLD